MRNGTLHVLFGFFAALFVASQVNIVAALGPIGPDLIQLQTTLSADTFRSTLDGFGADELARYRTHFAWDTVHPLIYGTLLVLWTLVLHRRRPFGERGLRRLLTLAVLPSVLDYVENAFHLYLETNREAINGATVMLSGIAANLKWLLAAVVVVLLVLATIRRLLSRARPVPAKSGAPRPEVTVTQTRPPDEESSKSDDDS